MRTSSLLTALSLSAFLMMPVAKAATSTAPATPPASSPTSSTSAAESTGYPTTSTSPVVITGSTVMYPYTYSASAFVFGDAVVDSSNLTIESVPDDDQVYDAAGSTGGILNQYATDRANGTATDYVGIDDVSSLWTGHSTGSLSVSSVSVVYGGKTYYVTGTFKTPALMAKTSSVTAAFGCYAAYMSTVCMDSAYLLLSVPLNTFSVTGSGFKITQASTGLTSVFGFSAPFSGTKLVGLYDLDYGSGTTNGLAYDSLSISGGFSSSSTPSVTVTSGTLSSATIGGVLAQLLITGGGGAYDGFLRGDLAALAQDTELGFGQYFTDSVVDMNPLTSGATITGFNAERLYKFNGVDVVELTYTAGRFMAATSGWYNKSKSLTATASRLSVSSSAFTEMLEAQIPAIVASKFAMSDAEMPSDCSFDAAHNRMTCSCDNMANCQVKITFQDAETVDSYTDSSGVTRSFDVGYSWVMPSSSTSTPTRKAALKYMAVKLPFDVTVTGNVCGGSPTLSGSGYLKVTGLGMDVSFKSIARRGNPEMYDCLEMLQGCLVTDAGDPSDCITAGASQCSLSVLLDLNAVNAAGMSGDEGDLEVAMAAFEDDVEASTFTYLSSSLNLGQTAVTGHVSLSEEKDNLCISQSNVDDAEEQIEDQLEDNTWVKLHEQAADTDLLGTNAPLLERIFGYLTAHDLADSAGLDFEDTVHTSIGNNGTDAVWGLEERITLP